MLHQLPWASGRAGSKQAAGRAGICPVTAMFSCIAQELRVTRLAHVKTVNRRVLPLLLRIDALPLARPRGRGGARSRA